MAQDASSKERRDILEGKCFFLRISVSIACFLMKPLGSQGHCIINVFFDAAQGMDFKKAPPSI